MTFTVSVINLVKNYGISMMIVIPPNVIIILNFGSITEGLVF